MPSLSLLVHLPPNLPLPLHARGRRTGTCLNRLHRNRLASVPLPLLRQSDSERVLINLYDGFHKKCKSNNYWNITNRNDVQVRSSIPRRNGTIMSMHFTNRNTVPVRSSRFRALYWSNFCFYSKVLLVKKVNEITFALQDNWMTLAFRVIRHLLSNIIELQIIVISEW